MGASSQRPSLTPDKTDLFYAILIAYSRLVGVPFTHITRSTGASPDGCLPRIFEMLVMNEQISPDLSYTIYSTNLKERAKVKSLTKL